MLGEGCSCDKKIRECPDIGFSASPLQGREPLTVTFNAVFEKNRYRRVFLLSEDFSQPITDISFSDEEMGKSFSLSFTHTYYVPPGRLEIDYAVSLTGVLSDGRSCYKRTSILVQKNLPPFVRCSHREKISSNVCPCLWQFYIEVEDEGDYGAIQLDINSDGEIEYSEDVRSGFNGQHTILYCVQRGGILHPSVNVVDDGGLRDEAECQLIGCGDDLFYLTEFDVSGTSLENISFSYNGKAYGVVNNQSGGTWIVDVSDASNPEVLSVIEGVSGDMAVHFYNSIPVLFIGAGGIKMYDLRDPKNPQYISSSGKLSLPVKSIEVQDYPGITTLVYFIEPFNEAYLCKIDSPENFGGISQCRKFDLKAKLGTNLEINLSDIAVLGKGSAHYAYIAYQDLNNPDSLCILNVDPVNLIILSSTCGINIRSDFNLPVKKIEIDDSKELMYVIDDGTCTGDPCDFGVRIYSIKDGTAPQLLTNCAFNNSYDGSGENIQPPDSRYNYSWPKQARDIFPFAGTLAYIAWGNHGWQEIYVDNISGCVSSTVLCPNERPCFCRQKRDLSNTCVYPPASGEVLSISRVDAGAKEIIFSTAGERGFILHDFKSLNFFQSHMDIGGTPVDVEGLESSATLAVSKGDGGISFYSFSNSTLNNPLPVLGAHVDEDAQLTLLSSTENFLYAVGETTVFIYSVTDVHKPQKIVELTIESANSIPCMDAFSSGDNDFLWICEVGSGGEKLRVFKNTGTSIIETGSTSPIFTNLRQLVVCSHAIAVDNSKIYLFNRTPSGNIVPEKEALLPPETYSSSLACSENPEYIFLSSGYDHRTLVFDSNLQEIDIFEGDFGPSDDVVDSLVFSQFDNLSQKMLKGLILGLSQNVLLRYDITDYPVGMRLAFSPSGYIRRVKNISTLYFPIEGLRVYFTNDGSSKITVYLDPRY